jgi:hypothetical protein
VTYRTLAICPVNIQSDPIVLDIAVRRDPTREMNPGALGFNEISGGHHRGIFCGICVNVKGYGDYPYWSGHRTSCVDVSVWYVPSGIVRVWYLEVVGRTPCVA